MKTNYKVFCIILAIVMLFSFTFADDNNYKVEAAENDYGLSNPKVAYKTRECIYFGNYWQEDTNGDGVVDQTDDKQPIKWQVLSKNGNDVLLLADKILDCKIYNDKYTYYDNYFTYGCTWETSTIREWLNDDFINNAFNANEQKAIIPSALTNYDNPDYGTEGGADTVDNIFFLSLYDARTVNYNFADTWYTADESRSGKVTGYAKSQGITVFSNNTSLWWLRTQGIHDTTSCVVDSSGYTYISGYDMKQKVGVRPAMHLNISSATGLYKNTDSIKVAVKGTKYDTVSFGRYNNIDLIWRVLRVNGDDALLITDKCVDENIYDDHTQNITWKDSCLRKWLNEDFYNYSFTENERAAIKTMKLQNDNPVYKTKGGEDTEDNVYILSVDDMINPGFGFSDIYGSYDKVRVSKLLGEEKEVDWWLRTAGKEEDAEAFVSDDGSVVKAGHSINKWYGVRPVIHIKLSSGVWEKGTPIEIGDVTGATEQEGYSEKAVESTKKEEVIPSSDPSGNPKVTPSDKDSAKSVTAPAKVVIKKVTNLKRRKLKIKWKKINGVKGYQVQYALNKKFTKGRKTKLQKKTTFTAKKLKMKRTYYVRVRAYKLNSKGDKVFGKWSKVKKIKIKK